MSIKKEKKCEIKTYNIKNLINLTKYIKVTKKQYYWAFYQNNLLKSIISSKIIMFDINQIYRLQKRFETNAILRSLRG